MMTVGEQRHMAIVEAQLRRIADALERLATNTEGNRATKRCTQTERRTT